MQVLGDYRMEKEATNVLEVGAPHDWWTACSPPCPTDALVASVCVCEIGRGGGGGSPTRCQGGDGTKLDRELAMLAAHSPVLAPLDTAWRGQEWEPLDVAWTGCNGESGNGQVVNVDQLGTQGWELGCVAIGILLAC